MRGKSRLHRLDHRRDVGRHVDRQALFIEHTQEDSEFRDPVKRRRSSERRYGWSKPSKKSAKHMTSKAQIEIVNFAKKCFT